MTIDSVLPFTGERFTPECTGGIWYEHWHRYAAVAPLAQGKVVLDAACGEGYGSAYLARAAAQVIGIDLGAAAIEHATERYGGVANLSFSCASVTALPVDAASVDLVVSFETIEHLAEQEAMLAEFRRVLKPEGILVLTSPNRPVYSDEKEYRNEYHVRELDRGELAQVLAPSFARVEWYGQRLLFHSTLWAEERRDGPEEFVSLGEGPELRRSIPPAPMYFLVVCGGPAARLPKLPALSLFSDAAQSVYVEYERLNRWQWEARASIDALQSEGARLREENRVLHDELGRHAADAAQRIDSLRASHQANLRDQAATLRALAASREQLREHAEARLAFRESWLGWLRFPLHRVRRLLKRPRG